MIVRAKRGSSKLAEERDAQLFVSIHQIFQAATNDEGVPPTVVVLVPERLVQHR